MPPRKNMLDTVTRGGYPGNMFVNPQFGEPTGLAWVAQGVKPPLTVLRILPEVDAEGDVPMFINVDGQIQPSYWMLRCRAWRTTGSPKCTFIAHSPFSDIPFDPMTSPPALIAQAVEAGIKNSSAPLAWAKLRGEGVLPKGGYLPYMGIAQALVYMRYDMFSPAKGSADGERVQVVEMSDAASKLVMAQLCQNFIEGSTDAANSDDPEVFMSALKYGDAIGLQSQQAKFLCLGSDKLGDFDQLLGLTAPARQQMRGGSIGGRRATTPATQGGGPDKDGFPNYAMRAYSEFNGSMAQYTPEEASAVVNIIQNWDDVLIFPEITTQVSHLSKCVPLDVLERAWSDFPDWIPHRGEPAYDQGRAVSHSAGGYAEGDAAQDYEEQGDFPVDPPFDEAPVAAATAGRPSSVGGTRQPVPGPNTGHGTNLRAGGQQNDPTIAAQARAAGGAAPRATMQQAANQMQQRPAGQPATGATPTQRTARTANPRQQR